MSRQALIGPFCFDAFSERAFWARVFWATNKKLLSYWDCKLIVAENIQQMFEVDTEWINLESFL